MKLMRHALFASALALVVSQAAYGQAVRAGADGGPHVAGIAEEILRLEREYDQAYARHDATQLERFQASDFLMTARGRVVTRAELLGRLKDPEARLDAIESIKADGVKVRVYGDTAVTTGSWKRVSKSADGKDTSAQGFFTRVWVRRDGRWQMVVAHYSPAAAPAKPQ